MQVAGGQRRDRHNSVSFICHQRSVHDENSTRDIPSQLESKGQWVASVRLRSLCHVEIMHWQDDVLGIHCHPTDINLTGVCTDGIIVEERITDMG